ncbi:MAG: hypothetical protein U0X39_08510 [Bacteroidales bacterium]
MKFPLALFLPALLVSVNAFSQPGHSALPGRGLKEHPFLYVGEWDTRNPLSQKMTIVRKGKVAWQYSIPMRTLAGSIQEFDDATLLPDGNIVFACMSMAGIITPGKNLIWQYICSPGEETHSCIPCGIDSVLLAVNGNPARVLIVNTRNNTILKEIKIPVENSNPHAQFRHVRFTADKTILVPHLGGNKVVEYDLDGKELWSVRSMTPWSAVRLENGNTLIAGDRSGYVREVNIKGETIWELTGKDVPFTLFNVQTASRLANGNTVICNWCAGNNKWEEWPGTVQVFEVTPDKKVKWALSSWENPDLGPATYIQLLDEPGNPASSRMLR